MSTDAKTIRRLIRTDTASVCHPSLREGWDNVGTSGADGPRGHVFRCSDLELRTSRDYSPADPRPVTLMEEIERQLGDDLKATD